MPEIRDVIIKSETLQGSVPQRQAETRLEKTSFCKEKKKLLQRDGFLAFS